MRRSKLDHHIAFKHDNNSEFFCVVCKEQFGTKIQVDKHVQQHIKDYGQLKKLKEENTRLKRRLNDILTPKKKKRKVKSDLN